MQKMNQLLLLAMLLFAKAHAQQKSFDQPIRLKNCSIQIEANAFVATTHVEMEFYNPQDKEVEGYRTFQLNDGQVITDFQLELNGKFRDGSIDERWKANRAYSQIVGKRIDPAILQMDYADHYSLRIYPIAAHGSRKINFTISQLLSRSADGMQYTLPLNFTDITEQVGLTIDVTDTKQLPRSSEGLVTDIPFTRQNNHAALSWNATNVKLNKPVSFLIPVKDNAVQLCVAPVGNGGSFSLNLLPGISQYYPAKAEHISVYWDVSLSSTSRDRVKELEYLKNYIEYNRIGSVTMKLFNHQVVRTIEYNKGDYPFSKLCAYLFDQEASGATDYSALNLASDKADAILLFTDGFASWGDKKIIPPTVPIICLVSGSSINYSVLRKVTTGNGGSIINLNTLKVGEAVTNNGKPENFLYAYTSSGKTVVINEGFPIRLGNAISLSGTFSRQDTLMLRFGNSNRINETISIPLSPANTSCDPATYKTMQMHKEYQAVVKGYNWSSMLLFGLRERVVTPQTSFLVLERVEDYVKYNIAPPKELEQKCAEMNYVYKSEFRQQEITKKVKADELQNVVALRNQRIRWWDPNEPLIDLQKPIGKEGLNAADNGIQNTSPVLSTVQDNNSSTTANISNGSPGYSAGPNDLKEVVVTGAFGTKRAARSTAAFVQNINSEQLNVIRSSNINDALAGKVAGAQVRSQSFSKLGMENMIRLRGENGLGSGNGPVYVLDGTIMPNSNEISADDIEDVTVLQGPAASALFGPDGVNGAIVMNSKKGRRNYNSYSWTEYKLSQNEDVEYMQVIRTASLSELWLVYQELKTENEMKPTFYFDMADFFYERGLKEEAMKIMLEAVESASGTPAGLRAAAFILEKHKQYDAAIRIYKNLISEDSNNLELQRDLALAYYQNSNYQLALDTYRGVVTSTLEGYSGIKELALDEMNAIIVAYKNELDLSKVDPRLIKALPVDLKIMLESNYGYVNNTQIVEPGGEVCSFSKMTTRAGGHISEYGFFNNGPYYRSNYYYPETAANEYVIKKALPGKYRVKINVYQQYSGYQKAPAMVRIISFKNFQQTGQVLSIENVITDNQYGVVEIGEVKW